MRNAGICVTAVLTIIVACGQAHAAVIYNESETWTVRTNRSILDLDGSGSWNLDIVHSYVSGALQSTIKPNTSTYDPLLVADGQEVDHDDFGDSFAWRSNSEITLGFYDESDGFSQGTERDLYLAFAFGDHLSWVHFYVESDAAVSIRQWAYETDRYESMIVGAVPEPATFAIFGAGGLALMRRRRPVSMC